MPGPSYNDDQVSPVGLLTWVDNGWRRFRSGPLTPASGQATESGNTLCLTPTSGYALRVYYAAYNALGAATVAFRFGEAGILWLKNSVPANSIIAKDFGDFRYLEGEHDEALYLNLDTTANVNWNIFYLEVN